MGAEFKENEKRQLVLEYTQEETIRSMDPGGLMVLISQKGFDQLYIDQQALVEACKKIAAKENFSLPVGARLDAQYKVTVTENRLEAELLVLPPRGGNPPSVEGARDALAKNKVIFGILEESLHQAISSLNSRVVVAQGIAPVAGENGKLEPLVEVNRDRHPQVSTNDVADYRELGAIPCVAENQPLMRRHPPTMGTPGKNVFGVELPPQPGKDIKFAVKLAGAQMSLNEPDLLISTIAGQPILQKDGITVEPIIEFKGVNISTGNIKFNGSVDIRGDVASGMRIEAGGDVTISGTVEAAYIQAGGSVIIKQGVIGHTQGASGKETTGLNLPENTAQIHAGGDVSAKYMEGVIVESGQSVFIEESIIQCNITAIETVNVGKKGGRKGHIVGGIVRATGGVTAQFLGSPEGIETRVYVGVNPLIQNRLQELRNIVSAKIKEHGEIEKVIKLLATRPDKQDMLQKARLTLKKIQEEMAQAMDEEKLTSTQLKEAEGSTIVVEQATYSGTTVALGRTSKFVKEDHGPGVFRKIENSLCYGDIRLG